MSTIWSKVIAALKGPASSTDNAVVRWDGTTGKLVQNSTAILSDTGDLVLNTVGLLDTSGNHLTLTSDSLPAMAGDRTLSFNTGSNSRALSLQGDVTFGQTFETLGTDTSVQLVFSSGGGSTFLAMPGSGTVTTNNGVATLTNKTLTTPVINGATLSIADTGGPGPGVLDLIYSDGGLADQSITFNVAGDRVIQLFGDLNLNDQVTFNNSSHLTFNSTSGTARSLTLPVNFNMTLPASDGTSGQFMQTNGSGVMSFATAFTNPMTTAGDTIYGGVAGAATRLAAGTSAQVLHSGATPSWGAISLTADVSGTLPIANGGTNATTALNNNRMMQSSGGAIVEAPIMSANKALVSDTNGIAASSTVTSTELGYVGGVTSAIQTQLNAKASSTLTSAHIFVGNGSNVATDVAVTGDVTITNAGVTAIGTGKVTSTMILDDTIVDADINSAAAITGSKIVSATGAVSGVVTTAAQTFAGLKTLSSGALIATVTDGTNQAQTYAGSFLTSMFSSSSAGNGSSSPFACTSLTLTPGRWFVFATLQNTRVASQTEFKMYVSNTSGSTSGTTVGYTASQFSIGALTGDGVATLNLGPIDQSVTTNTAIYLNASQVGGTMASAQWKGTLYAIQAP